MNHYDQLKEIFFQTIEEKCHGIYKEKAYFHSIHVSVLTKKFAMEKHLDIELAAIMGLFHDYSQFINHSSFQHAKMSSEVVKDILISQHMNQTDIDIIVHAIANHSNKDRVDDEYSEILKDADVLAQYLEEPDQVFKASYQQRLKTFMK